MKFIPSFRAGRLTGEEGLRVAYSFEQFDADRALMQFSAIAAPSLTPKGLHLKRKRLALDEQGDQTAIDAAYRRLLAWAESGEPVPQPDRVEREETQSTAVMRTAPDHAPDRGADSLEKRAGQGGPRAAEIAQAKARAKARYLKDLAAYDAALAAQPMRHERRRADYPKLRPAVPG